MSTLELGCYVTHAKLPELGSGEVLAADGGVIRIRFTSGDRNFQWDFVSPHLAITAAAPARAPAPSAKRARKTAAKKAAPQ